MNGRSGSTFRREMELGDQDFERMRLVLEDVQDVGSATAKHLYLYLSELLRLGGLGGEIPRIVVLGQQSMGKTTVIDSLIGHPLGYSSSDIGTCCPIVFHIAPSDGRIEEIAPPNVLASESLIGSSILNEEEITECSVGGERVGFEELSERIAERMKERNKQISSEELRIDIRSRDSVEMIIVDLPGLKEDTKEGARLSRKIVQEYVSNHPNDIYILVKRSIDDPANWSWKQRQFLLEELGLGSEQTIVVGTRALEYLREEVKEVAGGRDLLERIQKRELISGKEPGAPLPLFMLELFSLSKEERAIKRTSSKKNAMRRRIAAGEKGIREIICQLCVERDGEDVKQKLMSYFSRDLFEMELRSKFGRILYRQLNSLEKLLKERSVVAANSYKELPEPLLWRENIVLIIRNFAEIANEMVTGNFNVLDFKGDQFLEEFGGSLWMNLRDGRESLSLEEAHEGVQNTGDPKRLTSNQSQSRAEDASKLLHIPSSRAIHVRQKKSPYLIGKCLDWELPLHSLGKAGQDLLKVEFHYKRRDGLFTGDHVKYVGRSQLVPVKEIDVSKVEQRKHYWLLGFKQERWKRLVPVQVLSKTGNKIFFNQIETREMKRDMKENEERINRGNVQLRESCSGTRSGASSDVYFLEIGGEYVLYSDASWDQAGSGSPSLSLCPETLEKETKSPTKSLTGRVLSLQDSEVRGDPMYDLLLLNEMSFRLISRWFKETLKSLEPKHCYSEQMLCQMLRSVSHVMSASNWQPVVVDVLQMNVQKSLIPLSSLASFASSQALKRIMKASLHVLRRESEQSACSDLLFKSPEFCPLFASAIDRYCLEKAKLCSDSMKELILEQTSAIVVDLDSGSLKESNWDKVHSASNQHFEHLKENLSSPLCAKLYIHFVSSLKEVGVRYRQKLGVETYLNKSLLDGLASEEEIVRRFRLDQVIWENENLKGKYLTLKEYYSFILMIVKMLKQSIHEMPPKP